MNDGGITITKTTTGTLYLADIQTYVPHKEAVYIPAAKVLGSKDLHRALSTKEVFQLLSTMQNQPPATSPDDRTASLEMENQLLREHLARSQKQGDELQTSMTSLQGQLGELMGLVKNLPKSTVVVQGGAAIPGVSAPSEAVGGEVPMFLPDNIVPTDATVHIEVEQGKSETSKVSEAASKLRELRRGRSG